MDDNKPCMGCEDRYAGCSDHCKKPRYLKWKERREDIRRKKEREREITAYQVGEIRKNRRGK